MAATLTYNNAYLVRFCTEERENRAFDAVDNLGAFTTTWRNELTILKVYILACLENQADPDDLFSAKLKNYKKEFDGMLAQAETASPDDEGNYSSIYSIELERG